ncbi:MAG: hypothetical protein B6I20_01220 [Bacteroidetes bacterium 4572_117]|nr:MAG: hypothetical protein B6I20_01220 [Bacteroidetes bacterium 4572_117]
MGTNLTNKELEEENDILRNKIKALEKNLNDELLKTKAKAEQSEEKFKLITNAAHDAIVLMDSSGKVAFWNKAAKNIFGYTKNEIIGKDIHNILTPERFRVAQNIGFSKFKNTGKGAAIGKTLEFEGIRKNGEIFPLELSLSAIKIQDKWNSIGIVRDITDRKKIEKALKKNEAQLETCLRRLFLLVPNKNK